MRSFAVTQDDECFVLCIFVYLGIWLFVYLQISPKTVLCLQLAMKEDKLKQLLSIVIENYIHKGDPIGSKFLHSLENTEYAPSTLRKYLNLLEKEGLLYQPYNSSGRIPTVK